jgi:CheY-like chemotaxis protein
MLLALLPGKPPAGKTGSSSDQRFKEEISMGVSALEPSITVLYVEDNPDDQSLVQMAFAQCCPRFKLKICDTIPEGIAYLIGERHFSERENFPLPDMMLLDFSIQADKAPMMLRWLRSQPQFHSLPVVVYSGTAHPRSLTACYESGSNGVC